MKGHYKTIAKDVDDKSELQDNHMRLKEIGKSEDLAVENLLKYP